MDSMIAYIPQDRLHAIAHGRTLPGYAEGAALFADISGFTSLTEALRESLGSRRGSEVFTDELNATYTALIAAVEDYHGSVIGFAGDAITCWFDSAHGPVAQRAAACAVRMQRAMNAFTHIPLPNGSTIALGLKVAIACGPAHRFVVGNPEIQQFDILAGVTLARVATAEHQAKAGEILLDTACATALGETAITGTWRTDHATGEQFVLLLDLTDPPLALPWPAPPIESLTPVLLRPWLLPAVYTRELAKQGAFLTELRPAGALFVRFAGIDYDSDPEAHTRLDAFIRTVQAILSHYGGSLLHVVIGDKGSYFCSAFGAPVAYEDNARRATFAALALQQQITAEGSMPPLQIGITQGIMRCGAYGSIRRCTYGIMSDEVNLAARLMSLATPGEILVSGDVRNAISTHVALEPRPPVYLKGKAEPWPIFAIGSIRQERAVRLHEPDYALPIIGRANELLVAGRILDQVLAGHGQVLGITAEAGLGKSRLVAEIIRLANQRGMVGYGGTCQATGTRSSYLVWQPIWRAIFDSDPTAPLRRQIRALEGFVHDWAPTLIEATPLLRPLLGLALPENRFTQSLEPKDRQRALHALLSECLAAVVQEVQSDGGGLLIVLEDAHWIDAASAELLMELIQSLDRLPVLLLLAYRPQIIDEPSVLPIDQLPHLTEIRLSGLDLLAAEQLIRVKLLQLFPARGSAVPAALVKQLMERAQGNPFYLEELLSYLHDRAIDPREVGALEALALPESLHRLILSRLDQLSGQQQIILKTSSVIGRRFLVGWLRGAFPSIAPPAELAAELVALAQLELTPLDTPEPELAYLFKHVITREVAYESLGAATRAMLHGQLASYLEQITEAVTGIDGLLDLLAYHYEQSDNLTKKRLYLRRAGEAAAARYANTAALAYLSRAMELAPANDLVERATLLLLREQVYAVQGERRLQNADLDALDVLVATLQAPHITAEVALRRARYANETTDFSAAERAAREAAALAQDAKLLPLEATAYQRLGWAQYCQRQYRLAQASLERSLALADTADDKHQRCATLNALSAVAADQGYYEKARNYLEQSFATAREIGNRRMEIYALSDLAGMTGEQGQLITAVGYFEQCLTAAHAIGDRRLACRTLGNLGFAYLLLGNYVSAQDYCERCIVLAQATSDLQQMAIVSGNLGHIALGQGNVAGAARYFQQCLTLAEQQGDRMLVGMAWRGQGNVAYTQGDLTTADQAFQQSVTLLREVGSPALIAEPLAGLAQVALARGDMAAALALIEEILANLETGTLDGAEEPFAVYLACYTVLRANSDPRATALLARARAELLARADHIPDAIVRQIFLEHVPVHRDLMAAE